MRTLKRIQPPKWLKEPDPNIQVKESQTAVFGCIIERDYDLDRFMWMDQHEDDIFKNSSELADPLLHKRFKFIGNISDYDFSIELENAQKSDSGSYKCVIYPRGNDTDTYQAQTNLTVLPYPEITTLATAQISTQNSTTSTSAAGAPSGGQLGDPSSSSSNNNINNNSLDGSPPPIREQADLLLSAHTYGKSNPSQLQARDTKHGANTNSLLPSSSLLFSSASTGHTSNSRWIGADTNSPLAYGTLFGWPWLLLALAFILMLANVYLIYQLVQRHLKPSKEDQSSSASSPPSSTSGSSQSAVSTTISVPYTDHSSAPYAVDHHQSTAPFTDHSSAPYTVQSAPFAAAAAAIDQTAPYADHYVPFAATAEHTLAHVAGQPVPFALDQSVPYPDQSVPYAAAAAAADHSAPLYWWSGDLKPAIEI